jgi:hypothetical protein
MRTPDIYSWIKSEENSFETEEVQVGDNWMWNFRKHVQLIFHLKNGIFFTGENNWLRAFKNIMEPMLELSYWTEDLEVKDVTFFIESKVGKVLSFFVKKYHDEVFTREHDLDMMFDEITESDLDYGGVLVQRGKDMPEVLVLNSVAFCDQTDILGGAIAFKHYFTPDKLRSMSKVGWGQKSNGADISLEELITLATSEKDAIGTQNDKQNTIPGKTIEVYIIRGSMPDHYLKDNDDMEYYCNQLQIRAFYTTKDNKKNGVCLYRKEAGDDDLLFFTSKKVFQRALGRGIGERLVGNQIWTNFLTIHKMNMLESASKVPLYTDDPTYTQKNKIQDMENLEITTIEDNKRIYQVPTAAPANIQLYENSINEFYEHAQLQASAQDPILGKEAASGTTFRGQERSVAQGRGTHDKRRGQRAKFIELIYRWDIIPRMKKEMLQGKEFIATLSTEELTWVAEQLAFNLAEERIHDLVINKGKMVSEADREALRQVVKETFLKKGNKHLLKVLKDEFKDVEIKMGINIANKQKNLSDLSDKLLSIFQDIFAKEMQAPGSFSRMMQNPAMAKSFENILEYGGMSIANFSTLLQAPQMQPVEQPQQAGQAPAPAPQLTMNQNA